jgi:hypothetical protein
MLKVNVKKGQAVAKGDPLSSGDINPFDVLEYKGWDNAVQFLRKNIINQYKVSGIDIRSRPVETIIRNMGNLYEVVKPGSSGYSQGELIAPKDVAGDVVARPVIRGVDASVFYGGSDLFERMAFQRLKDAIQQAPLEHRVSYPAKSPLSTYVMEKDIGSRREKLKEIIKKENM